MQTISRRSVLIGIAGTLPVVGGATIAHGLENCPHNDMPPGTCSAMIDPARFLAEQTYQQQTLSQWCWAACISMICRWHRFPMSQARIVNEVYRGLVNMPADERVLTTSLNTVWRADDGRRFRISAREFSPALNRSDVENRDIIDDLKNDRPLLCGARSHATVVARFDYRPRGPGGHPVPLRVHVIDPYPGAASPPYFARFLQPDEMVRVTSGGAFRYLASIRVAPA